MQCLCYLLLGWNALPMTMTLFWCGCQATAVGEEFEESRPTKQAQKLHEMCMIKKKKIIIIIKGCFDSIIPLFQRMMLNDPFQSDNFKNVGSHKTRTSENLDWGISSFFL